MVEQKRPLVIGSKKKVHFSLSEDEVLGLRGLLRVQVLEQSRMNEYDRKQASFFIKKLGGK